MVTFSDTDEVFSRGGSSYASSESSNQSYQSAATSISSATSARSKDDGSPIGVSLSVNDRFPLLTSTSQNFDSKLQSVPQLYSSPASKADLLSSWMSGIPDGATENGGPGSFATGLQRLDRQYAASSIKSDIHSWYDGMSSVGHEESDDDDSNSGRSVLGNNDRSWEKGTPYQGGFIGNQADCWSGTNGFQSNGRPIPQLYSTTSKSFVPFDGGYVEEDSVDESTIEDYHAVVKSGYRTRDDSRPPRSTPRSNASKSSVGIMSNLPDWKSYTSVSDVDSVPQTRARTFNSTFQPKSILKNASSYTANPTPSIRRPYPISESKITSNSNPASSSPIEEWQIRSDMQSFQNDIDYWHSKADLAESKGDYTNATTFTGIGNAYAKKWRGANRQLEEMSGKSITVYDYKSEMSNMDITAGQINAEEFMLGLEKKSAMRWNTDADKYASMGDRHMDDYCKSQSRAATWKAEEMERELNVKKAFLNSRRGSSYGETNNVVYSSYMPGPQGFLY